MKVVIKGGVWKNTEDEILKAAVMKYGKNQWARISSLLVRKTPKQCKARWYEWLDPSIKKTEWSKEEDEKLLHLAKLMPTQWRTIAPIVGRTSAQCLERYQRLLDEAESSTMGLQLTANETETGPTADDIRRLRPGEMDPDPETKPARPDPVDMDEDEKEMLSEARARLANTQGKKAKRKAREKQIEEARRLANIQKRRELRAAGIDLRLIKKNKGMNYNADIPFERRPIEGVYDTEEELKKQFTDPNFKALRLQNLEPKKRHELAEEEQKKYERKQKALKEKLGATANAAALEALVQNDYSVNRKKLALPKPQIGEAELEEIVKMGLDGQEMSSIMENGQGSVAQGLLTDYQRTPLHKTPLRTPRTPATVDTIRQEALNQLAMLRTQTPLLGEENPELLSSDQGTGFEGMTPRKTQLQTPNPLLDSLNQGIGSQSTLGSVHGSSSSTVGATPRSIMRDNFGINISEDGFVVPSTPQAEKAKMLQMKQKISEGFANLPKPKNDFVIVLPEEEEEEEIEEDVGSTKEDAAERDRRLKEQIEEEERELLRQRSQPLKLGLPRPLIVDAKTYLTEAREYSIYSKEKESELYFADQMIQEEMVRLLQYESVVYPDPNHKGKLPKFDLSSYDELDEDLLTEAKDLIEDELQSILNGKSLDEMPALEERIQVDQYPKLFSANQQQITQLASKVQKVEKKLGILLGGYMSKAKATQNSIRSLFEAYEDAKIEYESVYQLKQQEMVAGGHRFEKIKDEVETLRKKEAFNQQRYAELLRVRDQLMTKLPNNGIVH